MVEQTPHFNAVTSLLLIRRRLRLANVSYVAGTSIAGVTGTTYRLLGANRCAFVLLAIRVCVLENNVDCSLCLLD